MTWTVTTQFSTMCQAVESELPEWCAVVCETEKEAREWFQVHVRGKHSKARVVTLTKEKEVVEVCFL